MAKIPEPRSFAAWLDYYIAEWQSELDELLTAGSKMNSVHNQLSACIAIARAIAPKLKLFDTRAMNISQAGVMMREIQAGAIALLQDDEIKSQPFKILVFAQGMANRVGLIALEERYREEI